MGIPAGSGGIGGWTVGPVIGRRPAGVARDVVHPGTGARAVMVIVDGRFTGRGFPDPESVARAAIVGSPAVMPMLDAGLLEDGTRWYVTPAAPGPVLDPAAGCSPRRAATIVEAVARALAAVHAAGLVHGLVGPESVVPAAGRHAERPVGTTLLLDTGVAALLGDRADDLASVSSVTMPADRGPAADVHALGGLLLRLLTAAAPAGPALAALPVELRGLLSAMLDEHPSRRPTADAVARSLAGMREGLLATAPVEIQAPAPVATPAPTPVRAPAPVAPRSATPPAIVRAPRQDVPLPIVPAPIPAPHTLESPIIVPRSSPAPAPSLWTGPVPIASSARPARRGRAKRVLLLAGGVGLAGLLVGVVTHLPIGTHPDGEQAVAAAAENGVFAVPATSAPAGSSAASTTAPGGKSAKAASAPSLALVSDVAPAFVRPTAVVPSPLAASATSTTPSRNTTPPTGTSVTTTTAPTSSSPSSSSSSSASSTPTSAQSSSSTPTSSDTSSSAPSSVDTSSSTPTSDTPTTDPASSTPTSSTPTTDTPSANPSPSDSSSAASTDPSTPDATSTDTPSAS